MNTQRTTIRSVIIDDDFRSSETLAALLARHCPDVQVLAVADAVDAGIEAIRQHQPELIFLDVEMPSGTGFDLLEQLREQRFEVIFTTAHDQYALRAIKFCALDYLLKPIGREELLEGVARVRERLESRRQGEGLDMFLQNVKDMNGHIHRIALPTAEGLSFIQVSDIIRCEAEGNYTRVHLLAGDTLLVCRTLKDFEIFLSDMNFFRSHHSHLINLRHVKKYVRGEGGHVVMCDNSIVQVAKRKKDEFMGRLMQV